MLSIHSAIATHGFRSYPSFCMRRLHCACSGDHGYVLWNRYRQLRSSHSAGSCNCFTNIETNQAQSKTTDESGEFTFDYIRVGQYALAIEAPGFKRYSARGFDLQAGQNVRRTFSLEVGNVTESVSVTAQTPLVNAVSSEQLSTVSELEVSELPLSRRNFTGLLQLNTGVTQADGAMRLNGTGKSGTLYTVDGTPATADPESRTSSMRGNWNYINLLSVDAIQEVQVV